MHPTPRVGLEESGETACPTGSRTQRHFNRKIDLYDQKILSRLLADEAQEPNPLVPIDSD